MSDERHNPRIRRVHLKRIIPDEVVVYMTASSGAMGDAGAVEFYSIHFGQVLYFYGNVYNGLDMGVRDFWWWDGKHLSYPKRALSEVTKAVGGL